MGRELTANDDRPTSHLGVRPEWLAKLQEEVLEPERVIVDPHHHLWDQPNSFYLFFELLKDLDCAHDIRATIFVECGAMYRQDGDPTLRALGETEFANGVAAMGACGRYGKARVAAAIIGHVDLLLGDRAGAALEAHMALTERFRGIRNIAAWHADPAARGSVARPPKGLLLDATFRQGFAQLGRLGLAFDTVLYHTQIDELADLAAAFPDTPIVMNHVGGPIGIGPYAGRREEVFKEWSASIARLSRHENVCVKMGGFGMRLFGFGFEDNPMPPGSAELAQAWGPYVDVCVSAFGAERCMFESNFPVDKGTCSYHVLWNTYKRIAANCSEAEKTSLFSATAARVYRLAIDAA